MNVNKFKSKIRLSEGHKANPEPMFMGKKLLDPFAGFGSIPLEGLRLGLDVTAVELLPTAYIFLKAVLEYPKKFGRQLVKDVEKWGNWITEQLKNDPEIRELYDDDVAVYIGTWEVKCPHCGRWTPAVGNFWLARVKDEKSYKRLAYMKVEPNGEVRIIDLNEIFADVSRAKVSTERGEIVLEGKGYVEKVKKAIESGKIKEEDVKIEGSKVVFRVPKPNIEARKSQLVCLSCGNVIKYVDEDGNHYIEKPRGRDVDFYVKFALKKYHEGDERFARQRLLVKVKVKNKDLIFEPATREDNEKLWKAKEKVREMLEKGDPDVPSEKVAYYQLQPPANFPTLLHGMDTWDKYFNPRQLLTLIKIVRLIRETGKRIEEEKLKEGWSEEKAFEYAEAVATYLSMAMLRYMDFNSVTNHWTISWLFPNQTLASRGITMNWNWCDVYFNVDMTGTFKRFLRSQIRALNYLTSALSSSQRTLADFTENSVKVLQGDATSLNLGEKFDVIVTDPPYADDVPYTELSDFYYVWLKRALSDVENGKLVPRFHKEAFFKRIGPKWVEIKTQWQEFAKKEVSTNPGRFMEDGNKKEKAVQHFENLFSQAFVAMREHLKDDGILVTYYAHTDLESWITLIEAGWRKAKLQITRAFPLGTESSQRVTARGKMALDTSVVVVWRKKNEEKEVWASDLEEILTEVGVKSAKEFLSYGHHGLDLLYGVMASVLSEVTKYKAVKSPKGELSVREILERYVYPATINGIVGAIAEDVKAEMLSREGIFYTAYKVLFGNAKVSPNDIILLTLATAVDSSSLLKLEILKKVNGELTLYSPDLLGKKALDTRELQKFIKERDAEKYRNAIDVLHVLEHASLLGASRVKEIKEELKKNHPTEVEEAIAIARLVASYYKNVYSIALGIKDEREIMKRLEKDGLYEVILMDRLIKAVRGEML
ncbi:MAG: putative methylase [Pyrococcus sp.]|uniref:DUF1156 domain-containing protein n=1 Tax=Pyrococcus sp. TaxID=33866 RepID=UPI00258BE5B4|nr:DUF1156 domain-containing protein [Pyrococcus sp.]MDK2869415.1 putative methylase [Pyrococcus sp.]